MIKYRFENYLKLSSEIVQAGGFKKGLKQIESLKAI